MSDGVQIGGIGSRCGAIGMWTAATHEPQAEPIGEFALRIMVIPACEADEGFRSIDQGAWWQWRVA